jgi:hypothetical protein
MGKLLKQFAALPVMETSGTLRVLFITSRVLRGDQDQNRVASPSDAPER